MISSEFQNMRVVGISSAVPTKRVQNTDLEDLFGAETVRKIVESTGISGGYQCEEEQTAGDLCYVAARDILDKKAVDPASIGVLILVSSWPDYFGPATSFVLHKRLGLGRDCIVYDVNLNCSGYIFGLHTACSLMQCSSAERALVLVADTTCKGVSPLDRNRLLFGCAGAATLVEKTDAAPRMLFGLKSDGSRFKTIITAAGAFRNRNASREREAWFDGNIRSDYDVFINGPEIFSFSMTDVPRLFEEFLQHYQLGTEEFDCLLLHQANLWIMKRLARKLKIPVEKMPVSLDRYANCSQATIPVTICDAFAGVRDRHIHALASGFGVGLSWGVAALDFDTNDVFPIIHTDDYYTEGAVIHV